MFSLNVRKCAVAAMGFTAKDKLFIKLLCMSICGAGYRSWVKVIMIEKCGSYCLLVYDMFSEKNDLILMS